MKFSNDPFAIVFEAFAALCPGLTFTCEWAEQLHILPGIGAYGPPAASRMTEACRRSQSARS